MVPARPLAGLNIVVTRPREQAVQLSRHIGQAGGNVILFPLLEISPIDDPKPLCELVARLHEFDLAIFISPNAVRFGMEAIRAALSPSPSPASGRGVRDSAGEGKVPLLPPALKIAAVGQGSAKALRDLGASNILAPQERFDSEALLALPELQNVNGWRVVVFRGDGGRELLGDTLKARGAAVEYAACYRRAKPQQDIGALLDASPHAVTVTSSEALGYLWDMLDGAARARLAGVPLFAPHPRIAEAAQRLGWREVTATGGGDDGLLAGLLAWAQRRAEDRERRTA
ncbi:MAG: uroporphyrinogen-III synthase [Gallionellaceae bacterium]|nr:MAG: uroporphyrinogen-III synthase [Gallionellaceae bacterium]